MLVAAAAVVVLAAAGAAAETAGLADEQPLDSKASQNASQVAASSRVQEDGRFGAVIRR